MKPYGIWCAISEVRGVWIARDGKVVMFANLAEAEAEAERLNEGRADTSTYYYARRFPALGRRAKQQHTRPDPGL